MGGDIQGIVEFEPFLDLLTRDGGEMKIIDGRHIVHMLLFIDGGIHLDTVSPQTPAGPGQANGQSNEATENCPKTTRRMIVSLSAGPVASFGH
jgi:hypothetical protein